MRFHDVALSEFRQSPGPVTIRVLPDGCCTHAWISEPASVDSDAPAIEPALATTATATARTMFLVIRDIDFLLCRSC
jgi:hypothetical protein